MSELHEIFCTCYLWPWFGPSLTTVQYVKYFQFCGWRHVFTQWGICKLWVITVMEFSCEGEQGVLTSYVTWRYLRLPTGGEVCYPCLFSEVFLLVKFLSSVSLLAWRPLRLEARRLNRYNHARKETRNRRLHCGYALSYPWRIVTLQ